MPTTDHTKDRVFCYYAVAIVDVLGQTDALAELDSVPIPCTKEQIAPVIERTAVPVFLLRQYFHAFFEGAASSKVLQDLPPQFRPVARRLRGRRPVVHSASDTTAVTVSLRGLTQGAAPNVAGLYQTMLASAATLLTLMLRRTMIRGGIDVGKALEMPPVPGTPDSHDIYGAVLGRAYNLERSTAGYPRVVVGEKLMWLLAQVEAHPPTDIEWMFASAMAGHCRELLIKDKLDGVPMLDFMGPLILSKGGVTMDQLGKIRDFIASEHSRFTQEGKETLRDRYEKLLSYCDHSIDRAKANL